MVWWVPSSAHTTPGGKRARQAILLTRPRIRNLLGNERIRIRPRVFCNPLLCSCYSVLAMELTPQQLGFLGQLRSRGFDIVGFPMYEQYIGVRKGNCGALLAP